MIPAVFLFIIKILQLLVIFPYVPVYIPFCFNHIYCRNLSP